MEQKNALKISCFLNIIDGKTTGEAHRKASEIHLKILFQEVRRSFYNHNIASFPSLKSKSRILMLG